MKREIIYKRGKIKGIQAVLGVQIQKKRARSITNGCFFQKRIKHMGIKEVITAPQSLWQSPFVERLFGSIRRDCLDHVIVLNKKHLKRILTEYLSYYHNDRTHLGLSKDTPKHRSIQTRVEKK